MPEIGKSVSFRSARARYDLAVPSTFRLLLPPSRLAELKRDHQAMKQMSFSPPPPNGPGVENLDGSGDESPFPSRLIRRNHVEQRVR